MKSDISASPPSTLAPLPGSRFTGPLAVAVVLIISYVLMLVSVRDKSITIDEPGHAVSGYAYWKLNDYRLDPENGNLPKRVAALPLLFSAPQYDLLASPRWESGSAMLLGDDFFNRSNLDTATLTLRGRAAVALFAVALSLVVWLWSRQLFGPVGAMISLVACAFNPGLLANGPLMTSDIAAALFFALAIWRIWAVLDRITIGRVVGSTLAVAGLFLSKMSAPLIVPMTLVLVIARIADGRPLSFGTRVLAGRGRQLVAIAGVAAIHCVGVLLLVWTFFGFRYSAFSPGLPEPARFNEPWAAVLGRPDIPTTLNRLNLTPAQRKDATTVLEAAGARTAQWSHAAVTAFEQIKTRVLTPAQAAEASKLQAAEPENLGPRLIQTLRNLSALPEAYLYGLARVSQTSEQTRGFLNGEFSATGWHAFFPYVFLVKTPLPVFALIFIALLAWWYSRSTSATLSGTATPSPLLVRLWPTLPLWTLVIVYGGIAMASSLNLGHRHLLPIYPALFVLCGVAGRWFSFAPQASLRRIPLTARYLRSGVLALLALLVLEVGLRFPNYIAYFNGIISPSEAYLHLVDSSLDWGQELPAISRYLQQNPNRPAFMAYLGLGRPSYYGITARQIGGQLGVDWKKDLPLVPISGKTRAEIDAFIRENPAFAGGSRFEVNNSDRPSTVLFKNPASLRLAGGIYVISATMLQSLYTGPCYGPWNAEYEASYQQLKAQIAPLLSDDPNLRAARLPQVNIRDWVTAYDFYATYRFARLTAFLRHRKPDELINSSILVFNLTDADVARLLDGPPP